jgi:hypothetical protein
MQAGEQSCIRYLQLQNRQNSGTQNLSNRTHAACHVTIDERPLRFRFFFLGRPFAGWNNGLFF